jgi:AraC-like DNA-binding protein
MTRLQRLHAEAGALVESAQHVIWTKETVHGLEQAIVEALAGCLSSVERRAATASQRYHETVMRRFRRVLEADPDRALYMPEICAAIGVPERTLRLCCQERLGMGPKQYLVLRRMRLVRQNLNASIPAQTTVTEVATRFGFWHFGRFAGAYRRLFGEPPSVTLNRPPDCSLATHSSSQ